MVVFGETAVIERRSSIIERIDSRVEIGRRQAGFERLSHDALMRPPQNRLGFRSRLQPVSLGKKAVPGDLRRIVGQKAVAAGEFSYCLLDLSRRLAGRCPGKD